jgi:GTP-binding protein
MTFGVNTSPLAGLEGRWGTSRKLRERLYDELRTNIALRVEDGDSADQFIVSGRGELHLAILIETMRREGYEFQISRPEVILRSDEGALLEPFEELYIETTPDTVGIVLETLAKRRGQMLDLQEDRGDSMRLRYLIPTRGLLGFRHHLMTATRGAGFMHSIFHDYLPISGDIGSIGQGSLVAWEPGVATSYGLHNAEERGSLFVGPGIGVYEGMVVGEHKRPGDLSVNICKKRHVTNHRASFKEIDERLTPPRLMSLDESIEYLKYDELLEVTPASLRLRKRILDTNSRNREVKRTKEAIRV